MFLGFCLLCVLCIVWPMNRSSGLLIILFPAHSDLLLRVSRECVMSFISLPNTRISFFRNFLLLIFSVGWDAVITLPFLKLDFHKVIACPWMPRVPIALCTPLGTSPLCARLSFWFSCLSPLIANLLVRSSKSPEEFKLPFSSPLVKTIHLYPLSSFFF